MNKWFGEDKAEKKERSGSEGYFKQWFEGIALTLTEMKDSHEPQEKGFTGTENSNDWI